MLLSVACCATGLQCGMRPLLATPGAPASCRSRSLCMLAKKAKGSRTTKPSAAESAPVAEAPIEADEGASESATVPLPDAWEPIFPAEQSQWATHRVVGKTASGPSIDQVIERLRSVGGDEQALSDFCRVNRDLLDYRCMYKLTAYMLRAQNTRAADVDELRQLHNATLRQLQIFDAPLFQAVKAAETRLGQLLAQYVSASQGAGEPPSAADCTAAAGEAPLEVFAFWLVVRSAAAAWREKLGQVEVAELAQAKLGELVEVAEALEADAALVARGCLAGLPQLLALGEEGPPPTNQARDSLAQVRAAATTQSPAMASATAMARPQRVACVDGVPRRKRSPAHARMHRRCLDTAPHLPLPPASLSLPSPALSPCPLLVFSRVSRMTRPTRPATLLALRAHLTTDASPALPGTQLVADEEERLRVTRRLGCVACACQRHAFQSYNPMVLHAAAVYDVLLCGEARQMDTSVDIAYAAKPDRQSRLIEMAYEADGTMPPEAMQLYW